MQAYDSVFDAIFDNPLDAGAAKFCAELMIALPQLVAHLGVNAQDLVRMGFSLSQAQELLHQRALSQWSAEQLVGALSALGFRFTFVVQPPPEPATPPDLFPISVRLTRCHWLSGSSAAS